MQMNFLIAATGTEMSPWALTRTFWTGGKPRWRSNRRWQGKEVPVCAGTQAERVFSCMGLLLNKRRLSKSVETVSIS